MNNKPVQESEVKQVKIKMFLTFIAVFFSVLTSAEGGTDTLMYYNEEANECFQVGYEYRRYAVNINPADFSINTKYSIQEVIAKEMDIPPGTRVPMLISDANPAEYPDSALYQEEVVFTSDGWNSFALDEPLEWQGPIWVQFIYTRIYIPFGLSEPEDTVPKRNLVETSQGWGPATCNLAIGIMVETPLGIEEGRPIIPRVVTLEQNYPNPFNPATTIAFTLKEPTTVTLSVYDVRGRLIETLIDSPLSPGRAEVIWKGGKSGIYFYVLRVNGDVVGRKKMVLLK